APVEAVGGHAAEVADARQRHVDEPVEERPHARAAQGGTEADGHAGADLEVRDRLLGARHGRALQGDLGELAAGALQHLGVVAGLAEAHVDDDLLDARHGHDVLVAVLLHELLAHGLVTQLGGRLNLFDGCHLLPHSSSSAPLRLATRTLLPSPVTFTPMRVGLFVWGSSSCTLLMWMLASCSMKPPRGFSCVGLRALRMMLTF